MSSAQKPFPLACDTETLSGHLNIGFLLLIKASTQRGINLFSTDSQKGRNAQKKKRQILISNRSGSSKIKEELFRRTEMTELIFLILFQCVL